MVMRAWAEDIEAPAEHVAAALRAAATDPTTLTDAQAIALLGAAGAQLDELCALADAARRRVTEPDVVTFVVNRNIDTSVAAKLTFGDADDRYPSVRELVIEAADLGATEICMQGPLPAAAPVDGYLRLIEEIASAAPVHLHALRPPEVRDAAARMGLGMTEFLRRAQAAGLASVPGTAAQILDDEVRAELAPPGVDSSAQLWIEAIEAAHQVGLSSTATMVFGHVETPAHQVAHLRTLNRMQERSKGFTELILMPMVPQNTPPQLAARATSVASVRETRALHAVARLLTVGTFDHLQVAWTKLDPDVVDAVLLGGVDDLGGLLLDGTLMPSAGAEAGRVLDVPTVQAMAARAGAVPRQRTTSYHTPPTDRLLPLDRVSR